MIIEWGDETRGQRDERFVAAWLLIAISALLIVLCALYAPLLEWLSKAVRWAAAKYIVALMAFGWCAAIFVCEWRARQ